MGNADLSNSGKDATASPQTTRNEGRSKENLKRGVEATIKAGIQLLQLEAGNAAKRSGWHADRPEQGVFITKSGDAEFFSESDEQYAARLRNWQMTKVMLMVSELAEGAEEFRKGHEANYTYYLAADLDILDEQMYMNGVPQMKPEGVPSELADTIIRIMDFCFTEEIPMAEMILEKLAFNATRGQKHGGKAI